MGSNIVEKPYRWKNFIDHAFANKGGEYTIFLMLVFLTYWAYQEW